MTNFYFLLFMLTMFLGYGAFFISHVLYTVNFIKCQFLLILCCSVFLSIFDTSLARNTRKILNLQFSVTNLLFFKYKDK